MGSAEKPSPRSLAAMHHEAIWVWSLAWIELQDELGRSPSIAEWNQRALEIDRANT